MCRLTAYLGDREISLASLVLAPDHSLLAQSYAPKEMLSGVVNADGFGAAWYVPEIDGEPAVYRSDKPLWSDATFASIAPKVRARSFFAAVRSATPGLPSEVSGVPPFASGPFAFMHNGAIEGFRHTVMRPLRDSLSDESYAGLLGTTDSETIFAGLLDRLRDDPGDMAGALADTIKHVSGVCGDTGVDASLNLAVADGERMAFTRYSTRGPGNSLYVLEDGEAFPGAVIAASERLDVDPKWREVPDRHLLVMDRERGASLRPL